MIDEPTKLVCDECGDELPLVPATTPRDVSAFLATHEQCGGFRYTVRAPALTEQEP